jgi:ubiquinone/menaquinone biosynthesis C-methylase UbiE
MTDYSKIADRYDLNPARKLIPYESIIGEILKATDGPLNILDLACGTGNYLHIQHQRYGHSRIRWYGCDLSLEMLRIASGKIPYAHLTFCNAASLPYPDKSFEMITCNFAFHHFKEKSGCLDEIQRTLKAKGVFLLQNISPEDMTSWWVYHYFPSARAIDQERFWNKAILQSEL